MVNLIVRQMWWECFACIKGLCCTFTPTHTHAHTHELVHKKKHSLFFLCYSILFLQLLSCYHDHFQSIIKSLKFHFQPGDNVSSREQLPSCLFPLHALSNQPREPALVLKIPQVADTNYFRHSLIRKLWFNWTFFLIKCIIFKNMSSMALIHNEFNPTPLLRGTLRATLQKDILFPKWFQLVTAWWDFATPPSGTIKW